MGKLRAIAVSIISFIVLSIFLSLLSVVNVQAVPIFARKYGKPCQTCHVSEPKLNEFGERFRANGFQLPGTIEDVPPWSYRRIAVAAMLHEMGVDRIIESNMKAVPPPGLPAGGEYHVRSFRDAGGHIWMGGVLGKHLSFFTSVGIEAELNVRSGRFASPTHAHWEQAFFQYNNLFNSRTGAANIRFGLFELEVPFSNMRRLSSALAPYEVYNIRGVKGSFHLAASQVGTSINGLKMFGVNGIRYELAVVNGTNGFFDSNVEFDFYGRLAFSRLMDGFIKVARIGGLYYSGIQNLRDLPGNPYPTADMLDYWDDTFDINVHNDPDNSAFYRWGVDVSLDLVLPGISIKSWVLPFGHTVNVYGQYLVGHDDDIDMTNLNLPYLGEEDSGGDAHKPAPRIAASSGTWLTRPFDFTGGFVGADIVMVPTKLYFVTRYDWVKLDNQWADPVDGAYVRDDGSASWEYGEDDDGNPISWNFGDSMPRGMTGDLQADPDKGQDQYSRIVIGFRWHLLQPVTLIYEFGTQDNLFGFPEPGANMYNPDWVAGMGRTVNVDSYWHMFMVMFAF